MLENAFYFDHDYNAANDDKMLILFARYGDDACKAYGAYWRLIEALANKANTALCFLSLEGLAPNMRVTHDWLSQFVGTCIEITLFKDNGDGTFTSPRLLRHKAKREEGRQRRQAAGRKGGLAKAANESNGLAVCSNAIAMPEHFIAYPTRGEDRIGQESKEEESRWVNLSLFENEKDNPVEPPTKKETAKRFIKPTLEQLEVKFKERGSQYSKEDAKEFYAHYESVGWVIGDKKMKSWEHSITTWMSKPWYGKNRAEQQQEKPDFSWGKKAAPNGVKIKF